MKKIKLVLPGNRSVNFNIGSKGNSKEDSARSLLLSLSNLSFYLFGFLLPFTYLIASKTNPEAALFIFFLVSLFLFVTFLANIYLKKAKNVLVDPTGLLVVLLFSLSVTVSTLISSKPAIEDTFGSKFVKSFGGLSVIGFLGLFYFVNFFLRNKQSLNKFITALKSGFAIFVLLSLFSKDDPTGFITIALLLSIPVFFLHAYKNKKHFLISLLFVVLATYKLSKFTLTNEGLFVVYLSVLVTVIVMYILMVVANKSILKNLILEVKKVHAISDLKKLNIKYVAGVVLVPLYTILLALWVHGKDILLKDIFVNNFLVLKTYFSVLKQAGLKTLFVGVGSKYASTSTAFIGNTFYAFGIIGLLGYALLLAFTVRIIIKGLRIIKDKDQRRIFLLFAFISLFIALIGYFFYWGFFSTIIWWLSFSILSAMYTFNKKSVQEIELLANENKKDFVIPKTKLRINNKIMQLIFFLISFSLFMLLTWGIFSLKAQIY